MKLTQIRNATNRLEYAGTTFLIDPWLAPKHTLSFVDIPGMPYHIPDPVKENQPMPFYDLPFPVEQIMEDVDAVIVTHLHPDHIDISPIDGTVGAPLDKKIQIYCQNEEDAAVLEKSGFSRITVLPLTGLKVGNAKIFRRNMVLIRIVVRLWASCFLLRQRKRFILLVIQYGITEYRRQSIRLSQRL